jgi:fructokinase
MTHPSVQIFGEVLFDHFPDGRRVLGGAPFNVAWHLAAFGAAPRFISAVGADAEGERIRASMADWGLITSCLQTDAEHPTGSVQVSLIDGEPSYDIVPECAYDFVRAPEDIAPGGLLYHGTLALRGPVSAATLDEIKSAGPDLIFLDVNLREPWWSLDQTRELVTEADWVKLNRDELARLSDSAPEHEGWLASNPDSQSALIALAQRFLERHDLAGLIVTLGAEGALGLTQDADPVLVAPPHALEVIDTVGAGDAFAAVTLLGLIHGWPPATILERAQTFAARIVGQRGATSADRALYEASWTSGYQPS